MGLFEKFKNTGTKLVDSYKYRGDIKGSSLQYSTSEILGFGNGKGDVTGDSIVKSIEGKNSKLHNEASTLNNPAVKNILNAKSYTQKYHETALNPAVPNASTIDAGSKATFVAPSSPSVNGRSINTTSNNIPAYSATKSYQSEFTKYKSVDPNINSRF